jgi:hypothetical protein
VTASGRSGSAVDSTFRTNCIDPASPEALARPLDLSLAGVLAGLARLEACALVSSDPHELGLV